jgi:integrase
LTPDQAKTFLGAVKGNRLEAAYVVALALGLRRGELLGLSWVDFELDGPMPLVWIRRQLLRHHGQGVLLSELKTVGSRRTLHLSRPIVEALRAHRSRQEGERTAARVWRNPADLVFTSTIGTPLDPEVFGKSVPRLCKEAGLGHWSIHEPRHSCEPCGSRTSPTSTLWLQVWLQSLPQKKPTTPRPRFSGPPGSRSRHLGIKSPLLFRMS